MSASEFKTCFLLNYSFCDSRGHFEITLHAVTNNGVAVKIVIDTFRPLFFVPRLTPPKFTAIAIQRKELPLQDLDHKPVDCLYFQTYSSFHDCIKQLKSNGITLYESDVHPVERFLMERFVTGGFEAHGSSLLQNNIITMRNPQIRGCEMNPTLKVMSIDIETNAASGQIYSIACSGENDAVFITGTGNRDHPICFCMDEKTLLLSFFKFLRKEDPDILIGWNVVNFDLKTIQKNCASLSIPFDMGRDTGSRIIEGNNGHLARLPGRVVMDVPLMLRSYYHSFEEYSLNFVSCAMLNKSKEIELTGEEKIAEINRLFLEDKPALAKYNLQDAVLTKEIFEKAGILPNAIERSKRSGHLLDRTGGSVAAFDYLYLPRMHREGFVAIDSADIQIPSTPLPGGFVLEPVPGIYQNVLVFDFRSLYPSIIMTFKIDPLGYIAHSQKRITGPAGTSFASDISILPDIISRLLKARATAKKENNPYLSQAIKILMNSFYGVLGAQGCRFFSADLASTITKTGQYILKQTIGYFNSNTPYEVLYGDTDSLFVLLGPGKENQAEQIGTQLTEKITNWLTDSLSSDFGVKSALKLEYQDHFRHFLLPSVRGATQGSKKHYCGSIVKDSEMKLVFKGMESARSDWTDLAKEFQYELISRTFCGKPVEDYILEIVSKVKRGLLDDKLVYKKRLRKKMEEYTVNVPPHVQAARLLHSPRNLIKYLITIDGPQPLQNHTSQLDYNHYIDCQLKPVADSILEWIGTDFDNVISGQQDLFG